VKRREFISLLGSATVAWPFAARAQQSGGVRRIGVLVSLPADDPQAQVRNAAFLQGLQQLGWTVGRNVKIDFRWGASNADNARKFASELLALRPDVLLAPGTSTLAPLLQATRVVPIVFVHVADRRRAAGRSAIAITSSGSRLSTSCRQSTTTPTLSPPAA
jgi:putative ABC transport system substrate-binding protein